MLLHRKRSGQEMVSLHSVESPGLGPHEVHVWLAHTGDAASHTTKSASVTRSEALARRKREQTMSDALLRHTLSRYCTVHYRDWRFNYNDYGRPEIAPGLTPLPLRFNISHTAGLIACGVTLSRDIGIDVESLDISGSGQQIASRFFAPKEVREIASQPPSGQRDLFLSYWTLKEAYLKAVGRGLSVPLDQIRFRLDTTQVEADFDAGLAEQPSAWQFAHHRPTARHHLAVAVRRGHGVALRIDRAWVALDQVRLSCCL